ncbi:MAG TPA: RpiB/LacA/LacB family sugar-phosphate isomerase [Chitinispirillaceae bacterium]|nr:RpiB/LacA/LacB family sugar-phosphate isomerase [Chitinispirillaceae bacterium]
MIIGIAVDHGGYSLKNAISTASAEWGYEIRDFGAYQFVADDDYPDFVIPLSKAIAKREIERGIAVCGSGIGASICANKIKGVRAGLVTDVFSAHQGVQDDNMNVICMGARVIGLELALELVEVFLKAKFLSFERHLRRLAKLQALEE